MDKVPDTWLSISATTRAPRGQEVDGREYYFVSRERFEDLARNGQLLEWAEYSGNYYGTPLQSVRAHMDEGLQVILEIDVQGAFQVREMIPEAHLVFIEPPSLEELKRRLVGRGTEDEQAIQRRLEAAKQELSRKEEYDYVLVNDDLESAVSQLVDYVNEQADKTK